MKLTDEIKQGIAEDRASGMSVKDVAAKYGINKSTISKYGKVQSVVVPTTDDVDLAERAKILFREAPIDEAPKPKDQRAIASFMAKVQEDEVPAPPKVVQRGDPEELIQKILLNAEAHPEVFSGTTVETLAGRSAEELAAVLRTMEMSKAVRMLTVQMKQVFFVASRATEVAGKTFLKLKTDGLTDGLIAQQKELDFLFKELAIKHSKAFGKSTEPEIRLLMMFGIAVLQTDATNRVKERMAATTPAETTEKYGDL
jgi:hypothetical protein